MRDLIASRQGSRPLQNRLYFSTTPRPHLYYRLIFSPDLILPALTNTQDIGPCPHSALQDSLGAQLMFGTLETRGPSNDSVLKTTTTWGRRIALLALITLLAGGLSFADGKKHKLSNDLDALKGRHDGATVDVIIQFNQTPTDAHHQKVQNKGGVLKTNLDFIKGAHYSVPVESLDALADDPDVVYISPDRPVEGSLDYVTAAVNAPIAWNIYGLDGSGIGIAIIDSGIQNYDDFKDASRKNRTVYMMDYLGDGAGTADLYGHGTP